MLTPRFIPSRLARLLLALAATLLATAPARDDQWSVRAMPAGLAIGIEIGTPLRIARGIQNKVLEAMAMARPVVISSAPATGLEARSGHDCEIAHSGEEFVSRTVALLADVTLRRTMGRPAVGTQYRLPGSQAHGAAQCYISK